MKRTKAREDFGLLNITANESFEDRFTLSFIPIKSTERWRNNSIHWVKTRSGNRHKLNLTLEAT